jgi:hypothetical protein
MFKQIIIYVLLFTLWFGSGFTGDHSEKWSAILKLEGKGKTIILNSDAVYGGYNPYEKKFFLFGKNHMFASAASQENTKLFTDFCTLNSSGQFEFELRNINSPSPATKSQPAKGTLNFGKKLSVASIFRKGKLKESKEIEITGDFKSAGFILSDEADKALTGKFTLSFISNN